MMLVRQDANGVYDNNGYLAIDSEKMFHWDRFSPTEQVEIQQA